MAAAARFREWRKREGELFKVAVNIFFFTLFFVFLKMRPAWPEYYAGPGILTGHEKKGPRP
jgi:hypothetical protein